MKKRAKINKRIYLRLTPRASRNELIKISEGEYRAKVTAAPVSGKANEMLIKMLAVHFRLPKKAISIIGGRSARVKIIEIIS